MTNPVTAQDLGEQLSKQERDALRAENERLRAALAEAKARQRRTWELAQSRARWIFNLQGELGTLRESATRYRLAWISARERARYHRAIAGAWRRTLAATVVECDGLTARLREERDAAEENARLIQEDAAGLRANVTRYRRAWLSARTRARYYRALSNVWKRVAARGRRG